MSDFTKRRRIWDILKHLNIGCIDKYSGTDYIKFRAW